MECKSFRDLFSEYIDHQLDENEIKIFEEHLNECDECRSEFCQFEKMLLKLKQIKDIEPPKNLKDKIMANVIAEENKKLNAKILSFRKFSSIAATFLIIFICFALYKSFEITNINQDLKNGENSQNLARSRILDNNQEHTSENQNSIKTFSAVQNPNAKQKNSVINLYSDGIDIIIKTTNIESAKNFLLENIENIKLFEEAPEYLEFVLNKQEFLELEEKFKKIHEYDISFEDIDTIKSEIKKIIEQKIITEEGLIKFKVILKKQEKN